MNGEVEAQENKGKNESGEQYTVMENSHYTFKLKRNASSEA